MNILYEDNEIIVCHKPIGIATQTSKVGEKDMISELKNHMSSKGSRDTYIGLVHRLDQGVEGILVFAKTSVAAAGLNKQIAENRMKKYYYAIVSSRPKNNEEIWVDYLLKDGKSNTSRVVSKDTVGAKRAELKYKSVDITKNLIEVELITGRHHQIRVQMAFHGVPIVNDYKYGYKKESKEINMYAEEGIALCAYKLVFVHPKTKKELLFQVKPTNSIFNNSGLFI